MCGCIGTFSSFLGGRVVEVPVLLRVGVSRYPSSLLATLGTGQHNCCHYILCKITVAIAPRRLCAMCVGNPPHGVPLRFMFLAWLVFTPRPRPSPSHLFATSVCCRQALNIMRRSGEAPPPLSSSLHPSNFAIVEQTARGIQKIRGCGDLAAAAASTTVVNVASRWDEVNALDDTASVLGSC